MEKVLRGLSYNICLVYLDDINVHSKTFSDHLHNLQQVFDKLVDANLKLSPSKCQLFRKEVLFLGHTISAAGIATDPNKLLVFQKSNT